MIDASEKIRRPAFQFYPADWRKDPALSACSLSSRGLWIELMCIAHESGNYGVLSINGKPMAPSQIARMVGESPSAVTKMLAELEDAGVFSRDAQGCIFSRRMVKDEHLRNVRADAGRLGGNPKLLKQRGKQSGEQNTTPSSSSSPSGNLGAKAPSSKARLPTCPKQELVDLYHEILPELPGVRVMDKDREKAITTFWQWVLTTSKPDGSPRATTTQEALGWTREYFERARGNDFIMGRGARSAEHANWRCSIEYLLSSRGMKKVIEETVA